jgi:hypothetical protein
MRPEIATVPAPDELEPYPGEDDPTDELPAYARLNRKYAAPTPPDHSIDDDVEEAGIEDRDPFEEFVEVGGRGELSLEPESIDEPAIVPAPPPASNAQKSPRRRR